LDYGVKTAPCEAEAAAVWPAEPEYDRFTAAAQALHGDLLFGVTEKHGVWRGVAHKGGFLWQHRGHPYGKFMAADASERVALYVTG
jgi:hypothetical protein